MTGNIKIVRTFFLISLSIFIINCAGSGSSGIKLAENYNTINLSIDSTITPDQTVEEFVSGYRSELNSVMNEVVGHAELTLDKGRPEAPLNNFVADLILKRANREYAEQVQVAVTNIGGLRTAIPEGEIRLGKIYEVMPFENELVVLKMNGGELLTLAKQIGERNGECIAGMTLQFNGKLLKSARINGEQINQEQLYYVATIDFLSNPGRNSLQILGVVPREFIGVLLRDAILDEIRQAEKAGKAISAKVDGRLIIE